MSHDVLRDFLQGLRRMVGRRWGPLGQQVRLCAAKARLRQERTSIRHLINLCAVQGITVNELLAAPRETSGPLLFDTWSGLHYMPLPSPRQAQKIYVASRCLADFLRARRRQYLPPMHMLLGRFHLQLLAIRDVDPEAYDAYQEAHSTQTHSVTHKRQCAAYTAALEALSASPAHTWPNAIGTVARVATSASVSSRVAERAIQSAALVLATQAESVTTGMRRRCRSPKQSIGSFATGDAHGAEPIHPPQEKQRSRVTQRWGADHGERKKGC